MCSWQSFLPAGKSWIWVVVAAGADAQSGTDEKGRVFTYFDDVLIRELVQDDSRYKMLRLWRTQDELGRETKWINMLVRNLG